MTRSRAPATISGYQFGLAAGILVGGTAFLSLPRVAVSPGGPAGWVGVALGSLLALPAGRLLLAYHRRFPQLTLVGATGRLLGPTPAAVAGLALVVWGHFHLAVLLREFAGVFLVAFMPGTPVSVFLAVTAALLVYASYQGMEAIVRTAQLFLPIIAASLFLIVAGVLPRFDARRLLPLDGHGWPGVGLAALYTLSVFAQGLAATPFLRLLDREKGRPERALFWSYALAGLVLLALTAVQVGVFSAPVLQELTFPTLSAARVVRLGLFFERFEAGLMVVWFALSFLKLALFFFFTTVTLAEVLQLDSHKPLCVPGGLIVALTALWPASSMAVNRLVGALYRYGYLAFLLPGLLFLLSRRSRPGGRALLLTLLVSLSLLSGGCWSRRELEDTSFVLAVGFEQGREGQVKLVVQSALPALLSGGGKGEGGGGGGSGSGQTGPVWVASGEGPTVFAALRSLEKRASDRVFLAHARALVFGEGLARQGLGSVLDYAFREPEIRDTVALLVTPDSPEDVLKTVPTQEKIPVFYLNNLLERALRHGTAVPVDLLGYRVRSRLPGAAVALPKVRIHRPPGAKPGDQPTELLLEGLGVFRNSRLVGYLPPRSVPGYLWVHERVAGLPVTFAHPRDPGTTVSVEILNARCRREVRADPGRPEQTFIRLVIEGEGNIREVTPRRPGAPPGENVRALDRALSQEVAHQVWRAVTAARQYRADIFGLAEDARAGLSAAEWRAMAGRWPEAFAAASLDVRVDLRLRRRGMTF